MNPIKVLYIEHDAKQRQQLTAELRALRFDVRSVPAGDEALESFHPACVDIVLCDLNVPGMSGLEVLQAVKKQQPGLPVIMLSANGNVELAVQSLRLGAYDFLLKPLQADKVADTIRKAIEAAKRNDELQKSQSHLQILMETVPDLLYSLDAAGRFLSVSPSVENLLGFKPEELMGRQVFDFIHPDDRASVRNGFMRAMSGDDAKEKTLEFRMLAKSGEAKYFEVNRRLVSENGTVVRQDGIARDISKRKMLEAQLQSYSTELEKKVAERTRELEFTTRQLAALNAVSNRFTLIYDEDTLLDEVPHLLCHSLDFDRGSLFLLQKKKLKLRSYCMEKDPQDLVQGFLERVNSKDAVMPPHFEESLRENKTIFIPELNADPRWPREPGQTFIRTKAVVMAPIRVNKQSIGLLVGNMQHHEREMDRQDVARFEMFVNMVGLSLDNIRAYQSLESKVKEKTRELRKANRELQKKAMEAEQQSYSLGRANVKLLAAQEELEKKNREMQKLLNELSESEEKFRQLTENITEVFWIAEAKSKKVLYVSPAFEQQFGKPREDLYKSVDQILNYVHPDDRERILKSFNEEFTANKEEEYRILRTDGSVRWIRERAFPIKNEHGEIYRICGISEDVTERKLAEEALQKSLRDLEQANLHLQQTQAQLVQSEKMASLGMLVAGIAHEINTPIGAINSMHDTLKRAIAKLKRLLDEACLQDFHDSQSLSSVMRIIEDANKVIDSGTERVTNIIRRLRSFARLDEAELKTVDIHEGLEDTLTLIQHEIKHRITVIKDYGKLPAIACFPGRLNQVFLNLLINARQAIQDKGAITIRTFQEGGKVFIQIRDDGVGIPAEKVKRIFDPGFTTKGVGVGTGLGLSICYQIIEEHQGEITVQSEIGKGTTFTIALPMNLDELLEKS